MRGLLFLLLIVSTVFPGRVMAQDDSLSCRLTPFVKGGLSIGFLEGNASSMTSVGHTGFHIAAGIFIPFTSNPRGFCLIPSLEFITKGDTWDLGERGRATLDMEYIELPIDLAYYLSFRNWRLVFGAGGYVSYGVGGRLTGSDGLYIYHGYRLADKPDTFGPIIHADRWDGGLHLLGAAQWKHLFLTAEIDKGLFRLVPGRLDRGNSSLTAISLSLGWAF